MRITVFTPTYNRAYIIKNLYNSLLEQDFRDFEWVVVDDGSTDETESLFQRFQREASFPIQYRKVENGGKQRAINKGVSMAKGELFFTVDSDSYLPKNALSMIDKVEKTIPIEEKSKFAGVCGLRGFVQGGIIGKTFDGEFLDITNLDRRKNGIFGDKAEVLYTQILKKYPFPEFEGEKFVTEAVVWDRIAYEGYKTRFFNEIVYIGDYLADGLTAKYDTLLKNNPKGHGLYIYQSVVFGKLRSRLKYNSYLQYYQWHKKEISLSEISKNLHKNPFVLYIHLMGFRMIRAIYRIFKGNGTDV